MVEGVPAEDEITVIEVKEDKDSKKEDTPPEDNSKYKSMDDVPKKDRKYYGI